MKSPKLRRPMKQMPALLRFEAGRRDSEAASWRTAALRRWPGWWGGVGFGWVGLGLGLGWCLGVGNGVGVGELKRLLW